MKKLLTILFLSTNLAQAEECPNASPWGEIRGAFVGAWAGNQLGGSGLWTIGGAIVGSYVGEKVEQAILPVTIIKYMNLMLISYVMKWALIIRPAGPNN